VTKVRAAYVTIRGDDGKEITLDTQEDFRQKVGVGSLVTAWYRPGGDEYDLEWLDYPWENFFVASDEIRNRVKKVAILTSAQVPGAGDLFEAVAKYVQSHLGWNVAPPSPKADVPSRLGETNSTLDAIDPSTGEFDMSRYLGAGGSSVPKLMAETRSQAVLEVDVLAVQAKLKGKVAAWDGIEEPVGAAAKASEVPAATVALKLWGDHGKLLWSNSRGLAVLTVSDGRKLRDRSLREALENPAGIEKWLDMMLGGLASGQPQTTHD
jgi:hypothetical protein